MNVRKPKPKKPGQKKAVEMEVMDPRLHDKWVGWVPGTDQLIASADTFEGLQDQLSTLGLEARQVAFQKVEPPQLPAQLTEVART